MIKLNTKNGSLTINAENINFKMQIFEFNKYIDNSLFLIMKNNDYEIYNMKLEKDNLGLNFQFFKNKLNTITISTLIGNPFEISKLMIDETKKILNELGGEKEYSWGKVEYFEDRKGGFVGINICGAPSLM